MDLSKAGGAAFPHTFIVEGPATDPVTGADVPDGRKHGHFFPGMTLRDYFAAKALQGFCANPAVFAENGRIGWALVNRTEAELAEYCFNCADAMLAAQGVA